MSERRHRYGIVVWLSATWLGGLAAAAILAPWLPLDDPSDTHSGVPLSIPTSHNLLGTDQLGRDLLSRVIFGARVSIVVGIAVAGLPAHNRTRVMAIGIAGATALRVVFAAFTVQLLHVIGLLLAGGLLLLWICWKLWGELRMGKLAAEAAEVIRRLGKTHRTLSALRLVLPVGGIRLHLLDALALLGRHLTTLDRDLIKERLEASDRLVALVMRHLRVGSHVNLSISLSVMMAAA